MSWENRNVPVSKVKPFPRLGVDETSRSRPAGLKSFQGKDRHNLYHLSQGSSDNREVYNNGRAT
jgi:hypothetical protein